MCRDIVDSLLAVSRSFVCGVDGVFGDDFSGGAVDGDGVVACYEDEDWVVCVGSADAEAEEFS